jgi:hypothetical protein
VLDCQCTPRERYVWVWPVFPYTLTPAHGHGRKREEGCPEHAACTAEAILETAKVQFPLLKPPNAAVASGDRTQISARARYNSRPTMRRDLRTAECAGDRILGTLRIAGLVGACSQPATGHRQRCQVLSPSIFYLKQRRSADRVYANFQQVLWKSPRRCAEVRQRQQSRSHRRFARDELTATCDCKRLLRISFAPANPPGDVIFLGPLRRVQRDGHSNGASYPRAASGRNAPRQHGMQIRCAESLISKCRWAG